MGEVRRPEDVIHGKRELSTDLTPRPIPRPIYPDSFDEVKREIKFLRIEIVKIKRALRAQGIAIE